MDFHSVEPPRRVAAYFFSKGQHRLGNARIVQVDLGVDNFFAKAAKSSLRALSQSREFSGFVGKATWVF